MSKNGKLVRVIKSLQDENSRLHNTIRELASRPPVIVRTGEDVTAALEKLVALLNPPIVDQPATTSPLPYDLPDLDGIDRKVQYFPSVEFDEWTRTEEETDTWSAHTAPRSMNGDMPTHVIDQGTVRRTDGTPMFGPGQGAPPPRGGIE